MITVEEVVAEIRSHRDEAAIAGMARYCIKVKNAHGMPVPEVRALGKRIVKELGARDAAPRHDFALDPWRTGPHEAHLLAPLVALPGMVTAEQMEAWVSVQASRATRAPLGSNPFDPPGVVQTLDGKPLVAGAEARRMRGAQACHQRFRVLGGEPLAQRSQVLFAGTEPVEQQHELPCHTARLLDDHGIRRHAQLPVELRASGGRTGDRRRIRRRRVAPGCVPRVRSGSD